LKKEVFNFLNSYADNPFQTNRIIISNFLYSRSKITTNSSLINKHIIKETDNDFNSVLNFINIQKIEDFEDLIEAFEFVISPADKILNGAIYTPKKIREYIIGESLSKYIGD